MDASALEELDAPVRHRRRQPRLHRSPPKPPPALVFDVAHGPPAGVTTRAQHKRLRCMSYMPCESANPFDSLCDDLVLAILTSLSSRAHSPAHLIAVMLTCKRFHTLTMQKKVLACASKHAIAVRALSWCENAAHFMRQCADSGNTEACFTLGMIKFYCTGERREGVKLLAKAALAWHGDALFALAIIHFNGSGSKASHKNARAGVALCVRAALAGSVDATRELGHCFMEGQGLPKDAVAGRQLLLEANRKEAVLFVNTHCSGRNGCIAKAGVTNCIHHARRLAMYKELLHRSLLSDSGCALPLRWHVQNAHPAHVFLVEWCARQPRPSRRGFLRVCSHALCGRPETRPLEFRQCAVCSSVFYCSRSCQATDWKLRHMLLCHPSLPSLI